ncbi:MAG: hypothetical protein HND58_13110 [Planctomycetota bacterium]|nr:MAG: hypothetical protein HND58_13110 [Planctomycetota bacterium]
MAELDTGNLTAVEQRLCGVTAGRAEALLEDLRLHVETPTGGRNAAALDETRERFVARLEALGGDDGDGPGRFGSGLALRA